MPTQVELKIEVRFQTRDPESANAAVLRIPGDTQISIQEGRLGRALTGVTAGSVRVNVRDVKIT